MMMFVMQLEHNYPDNESRNKSQWTLWWIPSRPLITPENINTDYTKTKCITLIRHHCLSRNPALWNVLMISKKLFLLSLFLQILLTIVSIVRVARVVRVVGIWQPGALYLYSPAYFLSDPSLGPIFLLHIQFYCFEAVREEMKCYNPDNYRSLLVTKPGTKVPFPVKMSRICHTWHTAS